MKKILSILFAFAGLHASAQKFPEWLKSAGNAEVLVSYSEKYLNATLYSIHHDATANVYYYQDNNKSCLFTTALHENGTVNYIKIYGPAKEIEKMFNDYFATCFDKDVIVDKYKWHIITKQIDIVLRDDGKGKYSIWITQHLK